MPQVGVSDIALKGVDLVGRGFDRLRCCVSAGEREAKRGAAATDDFEHEHDGRANVRFRDFAQDARVIGASDPPDEAGPRPSMWHSLSRWASASADVTGPRAVSARTDGASCFARFVSQGKAARMSA